MRFQCSQYWLGVEPRVKARNSMNVESRNSMNVTSQRSSVRVASLQAQVAGCRQGDKRLAIEAVQDNGPFR